MARATFLSIILLALGVVAGCGGDDKNSSGSSSGTATTQAPVPARAATTPTTATAGEAYPAAVVAAFVRECERTSGGNTAVCRCAIDKMQATISYLEFKREDTAIAAGATPSRRFTNAIADCR